MDWFFQQILSKCHGTVAGERRRFRFRHPLLTLDSTLLDLCSTMFDWALFQRSKGAAKLHLVLDQQGHLPRYAVLTEGKASDQALARTLQFEPGTILVFDRGYFGYRWYEQLCRQKLFFVTRMRHYSRYQVLEPRTPPPDSTIRSDEIIQLGSPNWHGWGHALPLDPKIPKI